MNLKNLIKDVPKKEHVSLSDVLDIINYTINKIVEAPIDDTIEIGDWVLSKVDHNTINIQERYSPVDMSRFLHDEFARRRFIKTVDKI